MAWKYKGPVSAPMVNRGGRNINNNLSNAYFDNKKALDRLRQRDITTREVDLKRFTKPEATSSDEEWNKNISNQLMNGAQDYSNITIGMQNGVVDIAEGTALHAKMNSNLDTYQKFAAITKDMYPAIDQAAVLGEGNIGSFIEDPRVNDLNSVDMIKSLWSDPKGMDLDFENMVLTKTNPDGKVSKLDLNQFVSFYENAGDFYKTIEDPTDDLDDAFNGIEANSGVKGGYLVQKSKNVEDEKRPGYFKKEVWNEYNIEALKKAYEKANPFETLMSNPTQAIGYWDYIKNKTIPNFDQGKRGDELWIGSGPGSMKENGEYTDEAKEQRQFFKDAYTQLSINKNVPEPLMIKEGTYEKSEELKNKQERERKVQDQWRKNYFEERKIKLENALAKESNEEKKKGIYNILQEDYNIVKELYSKKPGTEEFAIQLKEVLLDNDVDKGFESDSYEIVEENGKFKVIRTLIEDDKEVKQNMNTLYKENRLLQELNNSLTRKVTASDLPELKQIINSFKPEAYVGETKASYSFSGKPGGSEASIGQTPTNTIKSR